MVQAQRSKVHNENKHWFTVFESKSGGKCSQRNIRLCWPPDNMTHDNPKINISFIAYSLMSHHQHACYRWIIISISSFDRNRLIYVLSLAPPYHHGYRWEAKSAGVSAKNKSFVCLCMQRALCAGGACTSLCIYISRIG